MRKVLTAGTTPATRGPAAETRAGVWGRLLPDWRSPGGIDPSWGKPRGILYMTPVVTGGGHQPIVQPPWRLCSTSRANTADEIPQIVIRAPVDCKPGVGQDRPHLHRWGQTIVSDRRGGRLGIEVVRLGLIHSRTGWD